MTTTFERVTFNTMRGMVAEAIRQAILEGRLQQGERLVERRLAAQFGASLGVVREALVELETEGFIVKQRNTATHVARITVEEAAKMFALRGVLEPFAMAEAAKRATPEGIADLRRFFERMCDRARANDFPGYLREDYAWHERVWRMAGNEYVHAAPFSPCAAPCRPSICWKTRRRT
jgi:DNA-binding GntR family transcriptional regulator